MSLIWNYADVKKRPSYKGYDVGHGHLPRFWLSRVGTFHVFFTTPGTLNSRGRSTSRFNRLSATPPWVSRCLSHVPRRQTVGYLFRPTPMTPTRSPSSPDTRAFYKPPSAGTSFLETDDAASSLKLSKCLRSTLVSAAGQMGISFVDFPFEPSSVLLKRIPWSCSLLTLLNMNAWKKLSERPDQESRFSSCNITYHIFPHHTHVSYTS